MNNFEKNRKQAFEDLIDGDEELTELYEQGMLTTDSHLRSTQPLRFPTRLWQR
jgi:hypothetical protein